MKEALKILDEITEPRRDQIIGHFVACCMRLRMAMEAMTDDEKTMFWGVVKDVGEGIVAKMGSAAMLDAIGMESSFDPLVYVQKRVGKSTFCVSLMQAIGELLSDPPEAS